SRRTSSEFPSESQAQPALQRLRLLRPALPCPDPADIVRAVRRLDPGQDLLEQHMVVDLADLGHQVQALGAELHLQGDLDALELPPPKAVSLERTDERHVLLPLELVDFVAGLLLQGPR